jgi:hypothetical protein
MGYLIEERVSQSDEQSDKVVLTYAEYHKAVVESTPINLENPTQRSQALGEATKNFFGHKGRAGDVNR